MLPKNNRVNKNLFQKIIIQGQLLHSQDIYLKFILNHQEKSAKISFSIPKTTYPNAVIRSRLRRIGREAIKKVLDSAPQGIAGVFFLKRAHENINVNRLATQIKEVFAKLNTTKTKNIENIKKEG